MFWADKVAKDIIGSGRHKPYWVDDMKTPSGFAHVGSLMGPIIHSMIFRALKNSGKEAKFTFVINDFDPADDLLPELRGTHEQYLGMPLKLAPSPDPKFKSMADLYGTDFIDSIRTFGVEAEILSSWEMYHAGKFDEVIREALDNAEKIQDIYHETSGSKKKEAGWLPFQVICENCGKLGTTRVYAWDGEKVSYKCEPNLVKWAQGCGHEGKISPFGGAGKLPWKVDWGAHWKVIGVTIEGAGKDHASAGGSYDIAIRIVKEIFHYEPPFKLPYEFLLIGGRKMSSSKGIGLKAHDLATILPPSIGRFLYARSGIKSQSNFDPYDKNAIPLLFDDYQKAAAAYFNKKEIKIVNGEQVEVEAEIDQDLARAFELSQVGKIEKPPTLRFATIAQYIQMPNMEKKIKDEGLEEWAEYARVWLEKYAPESEKFLLQKEKVPVEIKDLSQKQKTLLSTLAMSTTLEKSDHSTIALKADLEKAEKFQTQIYDTGKDLGLNGKETFSAIYKSLLGKDHGPKAAWLILSDKAFAKKRFLEISQGEDVQVEDLPPSVETITKFDNPKMFSINKDAIEKVPSISIGIAVIKGVSIEKTNPELEKEKQELLDSLQGLTTEQLGQYEEVISYRQLYKQMGIDWHSRRPSPEALLRRVALKKGLYTINTCVDAYNLAVMKNRVSVGAFDLDAIVFPTVLRFAKNDEEILLLGDSESTKYKESELAYFDQKGGYNIDFNFRDAQRTAVKESTKNLYINVDGINDITPEHVEKTLKEACDLIIKYCGGTLVEFGIITA